MTKLYKLVVTGPFNAGKTTFVNTLSDIDTVQTERTIRNGPEARVKNTTTVALDYGRMRLNGDVTVHLFGTPGQSRFDFMYDPLAEGMHGFILLIDVTDQAALARVPDLLSAFRQHAAVPYLLAANKTDQSGLSLAEIRRRLKLPAGEPLMPCVATNKASAREVVEGLIRLIETKSPRR